MAELALSHPAVAGGRTPRQRLRLVGGTDDPNLEALRFDAIGFVLSSAIAIGMERDLDGTSPPANYRSSRGRPALARRRRAGLRQRQRWAALPEHAAQNSWRTWPRKPGCPMHGLVTCATCTRQSYSAAARPFISLPCDSDTPTPRRRSASTPMCRVPCRGNKPSTPRTFFAAEVEAGG